jgi:predicted RNase H-like HicB family nuclease
MLTEYIRAAMHRAKYEILSDGTFYGEIAGLQGVYANAESLQTCREELQEVLEGWIELGLRIENRAKIAAFEQQYGMDFARFQEAWEAGSIPQARSYQVERDYREWEAAVTDIARLEELAEWPADE